MSFKSCILLGSLLVYSSLVWVGHPLCEGPFLFLRGKQGLSQCRLYGARRILWQKQSKGTCETVCRVRRSDSKTAFRATSYKCLATVTKAFYAGALPVLRFGRCPSLSKVPYMLLSVVAFLCVVWSCLQLSFLSEEFL